MKVTLEPEAASKKSDLVLIYGGRLHSWRTVRGTGLQLYFTWGRNKKISSNNSNRSEQPVDKAFLEQPFDKAFLEQPVDRAFLEQPVWE
ncbi:hypothetical protein AVEN_55204-1 [Araneus ventricosus]|uniref:Uncharacterized protein n=1 Tax=Araneus ventricosus TaxID=182803 RepID=A0A4Y2G564_ARAVE|nr:hypothetical protein AVEN_55204-1 [Araneus ventricosus]